MIENHGDSEYVPYSRRRAIAELLFSINDNEFSHELTHYNYMDFIGELGGVANLLFVVVAFFLSPIA